MGTKPGRRFFCKIGMILHGSLMRSRFFRLFFPYALFCLAAAVATQVQEVAGWLNPLPRILPYAVWVTGALLGWRFNRSRVVFAVLVLALAEWSLWRWAVHGALAAPGGRLIRGAVAVLLPLNLLGLALAKERGVFTVRGISRMLIIACQAVAVALVLRANETGAIHYLEFPIFPWLQSIQPPLPQLALIASAMAIVVLAFRALRMRNAIDIGLLWALLTSLLGLCWPWTGQTSSLFLVAGGLILLVAVIESSHAMAFRDELTGLPTRRALNETLLQLSSHYTIAMVDIDFFKRFNDRYGHDVGDQVLRMVAGTLSTVGGGGKVFRYGGEEFTVVFPGMNREEAVDHLECLRAAVASSPFVIRGRARPARKPERARNKAKPGRKVNITISIGVSERTDQLNTPHQVIKTADRALYRAKKTGRNRVAI
jgi:diguanylate cyclase (GGDEF)-like protein